MRHITALSFPQDAELRREMFGWFAGRFGTQAMAHPVRDADFANYPAVRSYREEPYVNEKVKHAGKKRRRAVLN